MPGIKKTRQIFHSNIPETCFEGLSHLGEIFSILQYCVIIVWCSDFAIFTFLIVIFWGIFLGWDFAILRDQLSVFGSEVTTRHHSFFVRGKLMVMQCQWRIALLVIFWGEFKCRIRWSDLCRLLSDISEEYIFTEGSTTRERVTLQKLHKCFLIEPKNEKF